MIRDNFFRSMSLAEDLSEPVRFAHYRPTRRATSVLSSVLTPGSATMVIAPYGSGKSLAAGVGALAVRNRPADREVVGGLLSDLRALDTGLHVQIGERLEDGRNGLVIALSGHVSDPLAAIAKALGMATPPQTVDGFGKAMRAGGWDHVALIWDEFGRHLEGIVSSGRPDELDTLQRLAERVARADGPTMSLTLLLHQNLLSYASRLNETTRSEWRKVEGRFAVVRMIEDSQEIYRLIGQVVADLRPPQPKAKISADTVERASDARWFDGMTDTTAIAEMLGEVRPLTAGALQVLPTLAARVGQHERSLFSFLRAADLSSTVGIEQIYAAFADALRGDVGIGGAYRRWVETESARSRAADELQREVLAAACLLQLGASGERRRLPRDVLELAVARPGVKRAAIADAIDALIDAKLLLWRRRNDDVAVWHGADIDVAIRVREEREKQAYGFDLKNFLDERFAGAIDAIVALSLRRGRMPHADEVSPEVHERLASERVSFARALDASRATVSDDTWAQAEADGRDDILVHQALNTLNRSRSASRPGAAMVRDIRHHFGSQQQLAEQALEFLHGLADPQRTAEAARRSAGRGLGAIDEDGRLLIDGARVAELEGVLRCYAGCAAYLSGEVEEEHIVRLDPLRRRVTLFPIIGKRATFPETTRSINIDLKRQDVTVREEHRVLIRKADVFGMAPRSRQRSLEADRHAADGADEAKALIRT